MEWKLAEGGLSSDMGLDWQSHIKHELELKVMHCQRINTELPLQVWAHLLLHLVDLPKHEHPLIMTNNTP